MRPGAINAPDRAYTGIYLLSKDCGTVFVVSSVISAHMTMPFLGNFLATVIADVWAIENECTFRHQSDRLSFQLKFNCPMWTGLVPVYLSTVSWPLTIFFSLRFTFKCFDVFLPAFRLVFGAPVSSPDPLRAVTAEFGIIAMFIDWNLQIHWLYTYQ